MVEHDGGPSECEMYEHAGGTVRDVVTLCNVGPCGVEGVCGDDNPSCSTKVCRINHLLRLMELSECLHREKNSVGRSAAYLLYTVAPVTVDGLVSDG